MATTNIYLGESFLDRLVKDTYGVKSLGDLNKDQMNELDSYMKTQDFTTKSSEFRTQDRNKFQGSMDLFMNNPDTPNALLYKQSLTKPDNTKHLIPRKTTTSTQAPTSVSDTPKAAPKLMSGTEAQNLALAKQHGFQSLDAVKEFQTKMGLDATGELNQDSLDRLLWYNTMKEKGYKEGSGSKGFYFNGSGYNYYYTNDKNKYDYTTLPKAFHLSDFAKQNNLTKKKVENGTTYYRYDPTGAGDFYVDSKGNIYNAGAFGSIGPKLNEQSKFGSGYVQDQYNELRKKLSMYQKNGGVIK